MKQDITRVMITDMVAPNIYKPSNWIVNNLDCKRYIKKEHFTDRLIKKIKDETGVNVLIQTKSQKREVCDMRQLFMVMMSIYTKISYKKIGVMVGKDHSTVSHANKQMKNLYDTDKEFKNIYDIINDFAKKINAS